MLLFFAAHCVTSVHGMAGVNWVILSFETDPCSRDYNVVGWQFKYFCDVRCFLEIQQYDDGNKHFVP